jgi:hypothetical protein
MPYGFPRHFAIVIVLLGIASAVHAEDNVQQSVPDVWLSEWRQPPTDHRPLQIVHGIQPDRASPEGMQWYKDLGLGGIVCNVAFQEYMQSERHWNTLIEGIESCEKLGLVVWLYDEDRYPSGAAGGLVLAENPAFEASELAFDPLRPDPFLVRPAYECTHASNNYAYARRYINLLDDRATDCFIRKTHDAYWQRLKKHFGRTIRAIFTDEPSLMAVNVGLLPAKGRERMNVVDLPDPQFVEMPCVPWVYDIVEQYRKRYGQDILSQRKSLFGGDSAADRQVRRQYWALVADLTAERYFGQIQQWCGRHRIASSGHKLYEEDILRHVPLDGNGLKVLGRMDIPGMDVLSSNPETYHWLTPALPLSAALLNGRRRVMTEVSDFMQKTYGKGPAPLDEMQATAAWQAAWGTTEFTLYYSTKDRSEEDYRKYCRYVGRLNAMLKPAQPTPEVLLYYPICDLWAEYRPVVGALNLASQSPAMRQIVDSFGRLGSLLQHAQIPFLLIDHDMLAGAKIESGKLVIGGRCYSALVLPEGVELPPPAEKVVETFRATSGRVLADGKHGKLDSAALLDVIKPAHRISPASPQITMGQFQRAGRTILLVVNTGPSPYTGTLSMALGHRACPIMDPDTGAVESVAADPEGRVPLKLNGRQSVLIVE